MKVLGQKQDEKNQDKASIAPAVQKNSEDANKTPSAGIFDTPEEPTPLDGKDMPQIGGYKKETDFHGENYSEQELTITKKEKSDFMDAIVTGNRYFQEYDIFGGRVHLVLRNRTAGETQAMYAYMRHELSRNDRNVSLLEGDMSYVLLVAQVEELNGTKYPEMKAPLMFTADGTSETPPGWLDALNSWKERNEALTSAIIRQIQLFEYKYWRMVSEAANKNFWNSDTSIAG